MVKEEVVKLLTHSEGYVLICPVNPVPFIPDTSSVLKPPTETESVGFLGKVFPNDIVYFLALSDVSFPPQ